MAALSPAGVIMACAGCGAITVAVANAVAAVKEISNSPRIAFLHLARSYPVLNKLDLKTHKEKGARPKPPTH